MQERLWIINIRQNEEYFGFAPHEWRKGRRAEGQKGGKAAGQKGIGH